MKFLNSSKKYGARLAILAPFVFPLFARADDVPAYLTTAQASINSNLGAVNTTLVSAFGIAIVVIIALVGWAYTKRGLFKI
jgi:hypothetical protein